MDAGDGDNDNDDNDDARIRMLVPSQHVVSSQLKKKIFVLASNGSKSCVVVVVAMVLVKYYDCY